MEDFWKKFMKFLETQKQMSEQEEKAEQMRGSGLTEQNYEYAEELHGKPQSSTASTEGNPYLDLLLKKGK